MLVPFGCDNRAFQLSHVAGRSRALRLQRILRRVFFFSVKWECYIDMFWLASEDNVLADLLSRDRLEEFWHHVSVSGYWATPHFERVQCYPDTGKPRTLRSPTLTEGEYSCSVNKDGASKRGSQRMSVPHARASIWDGLPSECTADL